MKSETLFTRNNERISRTFPRWRYGRLKSTCYALPISLPLTLPNQPPRQHHPDPYPMVPFPFSFLCQFLPHFDPQKDEPWLHSSKMWMVKSLLCESAVLEVSNVCCERIIDSTLLTGVRNSLTTDTGYVSVTFIPVNIHCLL